MIHLFELAASLAVLSLPYPVDAWSWIKLPVVGQAPKVSGHSIGSLKNSDGVLLFGGLTGPAGCPCSDETWQYQHSTTAKEEQIGKWTMLPVQEDRKIPQARMYGASAVLGETMCLFGGWDPGAPGSGGKFLDDIWQMDSNTKQWQLSETCLPYPVSRHTACTIMTDENDECIVIHTFQGTLVYANDGTIREQETSGDSPEGLSMCSVAPLSESKMLLFGGSTRTQQLSQDAYILDCTTWKWTKLMNTGEAVPPTLASPCATTLDNRKAIVFGGASIGSTGYEGGMGLVPQDETWIVELVAMDKARWTKIACTKKPEGRVAASLCRITSSSFLLQGGYNPETKVTFDASWILTRGQED